MILLLIIFIASCVRRVAIGGELGGPKFSKFFSAGVLIVMWLVFVFLGSFHAYGKVGPYPIFEPDVSLRAA